MSLDAYESPAAPAQTDDALAEFREQAKAELEEQNKRGKMSEAPFRSSAH